MTDSAQNTPALDHVSAFQLLRNYSALAHLLGHGNDANFADLQRDLSNAQPSASIQQFITLVEALNTNVATLQDEIMTGQIQATENNLKITEISTTITQLREMNTRLNAENQRLTQQLAQQPAQPPLLSPNAPATPVIITPNTSTPPSPRLPPNTSEPPTPSPNSAGNTTTPRPVGAEPPTFSGAQGDDAQRQEEYVTWKSLLNIKFTLDGAFYSTPTARVLYAAQRLSGDAYRHVRDAVDSVATNPENPSTWIKNLSDYTSLFDLLDPVYKTQDTRAAARRNFDTLKQKNTRFGDFISAFIRLADMGGYPANMRVEALKNKVSIELSKAAVHQISRPGPEDFDGWVKMYRDLSNNLADHAHRSNQGGATPAIKPSSHLPSPTPALEGDPMDLSKITTGPRGPLTEAQKQHRRNNNLCLYCGQPGHYAITCPARPKRQQNAGGQQSKKE